MCRAKTGLDALDVASANRAVEPALSCAVSKVELSG